MPLHFAIAHPHIVAERLGQLLPKGDDALLVALARHPQLPGVEVHVPVVKADELRQPDSGFVERHQDGALQNAHIVLAPRRLVEKLVHLRLLHELWQRLFLLRARDINRWVMLHKTSRKGPSVERLHSRQPAIHRRGLVASVHHVLKPEPDNIRVDGLPSEIAVQSLEEALENRHVSAVALQRAPASVALIAHIGQELLNHNTYFGYEFKEINSDHQIFNRNYSSSRLSFCT